MEYNCPMDELALTLAYLRGAERSLDPTSPALEQALAARYEQGRAAWPQVVLAPVDFAAHLGRCAREQDDPVRFLDQVHAADLYLACACAQGNPAALRS